MEKLRNISIIFFTLLTCVCFANEVSKEKAEKVAFNYIQNKSAKNTSISFSSYTKFTYQNKTIYHRFLLKDNGFIIIAGNDIVFPVLAYSLKNILDTNNFPPAFIGWRNNCADQILHLIKVKQAASSKVINAWNSLQNNQSTNSNSSKSKSVAPLIKSLWGQGMHYNYLCPVDSNGRGGHALVGCVAVSMAQIMHYYNYPLQGNSSNSYYSDYGYHSANFYNEKYKWLEMPNKLFQTNLSLATFLHHCGVAVEMDYGPTASGSHTYRAKNALKNYFGYQNTIRHIYKKDYDEEAWLNIIRNNLDNNQPILYVGYNQEYTSGHAFVCDGYSDTNYFHFNWGWNGNANGYFLLASLDPYNSNFSRDQNAVVDIYPGNNFPYYCNYQLPATSRRGVIFDGSHNSNYQNNSDCEWIICPSRTSSIKLDFAEFSMIKDEDYLYIYDGGTTSDSIIGIFTGDSIPPSIITHNDSMLLRFTSDGNNTSSGFLAYYDTELFNYCPPSTELTNWQGSFSDGSGDDKYYNSSNCRWYIRPTDATSIELSFSYFDTEQDKDFIIVIDEDNNTNLGKFSGNKIPPKIIANSSSLLVFFVSSNQNPYNGWVANYKSYPVKIEENEIENGIILYPIPTKETLNLHLETNNNQKDIPIIIYNTFGIKLWNETILHKPNGINHSINTNNLQAGIYLLHICLHNKTFIRKFIIL